MNSFRLRTQHDEKLKQRLQLVPKSMGSAEIDLWEAPDKTHYLATNSDL